MEREGAPEPAGRSSTPALGLAILLALLAVYSPALRGGFLWDDDRHVTEPHLRSAGGLESIWRDVGATQQYYPLLYTAFWVEHRLWGDATTGYHLVNVLLHALAAVLFAHLLLRLRVPGAWLAAAIFALHPVEVESVAWISEQKNTLSAVFYLGAALVYWRFHESRRFGWYALATLLFVAALLSKSVTATLPAALLVLFWWRNGRLSGRKDVLPLLPWFVLGAAMGLVTAWVERALLGASGADWSLGLLERALLAGRVFWFYPAKLLWPADLVFIYPRWAIDASSPVSYLYPLAALLLVGWLWQLRARTRAPLAVVLLYAGTLLPVLGFVNVYPFRFSYVADHFQYLPSLAMIAAAASLLVPLLAARGRQGIAAGAALLVLLGGLSFRQAALYRDAETLYRATLEGNPGCLLCRNNLGNQLVASGRADEAVSLFEGALQTRPGDADLLFNLGNALDRAGRSAEAADRYRQALKAAPGHARAAYNLAGVLARTGQAGEAVAQYEAVLRAQPDNVDALNNLAMALAATGRLDEAIAHYSKALRFEPRSARTRNNLGTALMGAGRMDEAREQYELALAAEPDLAEAELNMGNLLLATGQVKEAIARYEEVVRRRPGSLPALNSLAGALFRMGRRDDAIALHEEVLRLAPDDPKAHYAFASVLWSAGRRDDAVAQVREALRLRPDYADAQATLAALETKLRARPVR